MTSAFLDRLTSWARSVPDANDAPSCNNTSFKTGKKAFLFVGEKADSVILRFKLKASLDEARAKAADDPQRYEAADIGWVKVTLPRGEDPPAEQLTRWCDESFRLFATKTALKQYDAEG